MASLGLLIAGIAHEINTPIGAIFNVTRNLDNSVLSLPAILRDFRKEDGHLIDKMVACLDELYRISKAPIYSLTFKEIKSIEKLLLDHGVGNYKTMSATLARLNFIDTEKILMYLDCFMTPYFPALFESFGSIVQATSISEASSQKIAEIVRALKYYAYTDRDKVEAVQINDSIQTALILLRSRLQHGITVMTDFANDLPEIMCTSEIHQVWTNVLNNACDAIEEMGSNYNGEISINSRKSEDSIVITISDNGIGLPQDKKEKIFDPFFTTKDIGKGTGLGLSIVAGIIKKHGGIIRVDSRSSHTQFEIVLPLKMPGDISNDQKIDVLIAEQVAETGII
jgi:signal transduction histidine kinase